MKVPELIVSSLHAPGVRHVFGSDKPLLIGTRIDPAQYTAQF
jgi:hypothetical protein